MQIKYFQTAWNDIKNSPGWFGKMCLLALVGFVPVFGQIVQYGYLYGWAREAAWGVHEPLPQKIFGNEDGKLYRRGWFILVIVFVFGLVPAIITGIGSSMQQSGVSAIVYDGSASMSAYASIGGLIYFVGIILSLFMTVLAWVGSMRAAIYDRLSAGFQFGTLWKMLRHDTNGLLRVLGMNLLVSLIVGLVIGFVISVLLTIAIVAGMAAMASAGFQFESLQNMTDIQAAVFVMQLFGSAGVIGILCFLATAYLIMLMSAFVEMLTARALGYWTWQFDVPHWRGQNDPMPFEFGSNQA